MLFSLIGLSAVISAGTVAMARASQVSGSSDPFAAMPNPEAMDGPQVVPAGQVSYTVGSPRVRISGQRRMYRIDAATEQITKVRLANFGLVVFRAGEQLGTFDGRQYVQIASGRWSGWWVKAPSAAPFVTDQYSSAHVELSAGLHTGVRFYASGNVRVRRPVYLGSPTSFSVTRRATVDGRDFYLVKDGPLADRWVQGWKGATLIVAPAISPGENTPVPTGQPEPTAAPQEAAAPAATWKAVVLVYPSTNVTFKRADGTEYHMNTQMGSEMHDLVLNTLHRFPRAVANWSDGLVKMDLDIVEVPHAITSLDKLGAGYWVGPSSIEQDLDRYAPDGRYDSIFVVWKARDQHEFVPVGGWGLSLPPGAWANGAGYSSIITPSDMWWWTDSVAPEEVFVHEWMHEVLYWQEQHGRLNLDLHAGESYGYQSTNGTWKRWLSDVMQGKVRDGNHFTGVDRDMWAADQPTKP
ncbi:MAG: hypothetical protein ABI797_00360 [Chloroflexota bacterium]